MREQILKWNDANETKKGSIVHAIFNEINQENNLNIVLETKMPEEIFSLIMGIAVIYLIYKAAYVVPNDIKRIESKVDNLKLHLKEMSIVAEVVSTAQ